MSHGLAGSTASSIPAELGLAQAGGLPGQSGQVQRGRPSFPAHQHDPVQVRQGVAGDAPFPARDQLVQDRQPVDPDRRVDADQHAGLGAVQHHGQFVGPVGEVDRHGHRAEPGDGQLDRDELGPVVDHQGHPVTRADPDSVQPAGQLPRPLLQVAVGVAVRVGDDVRPFRVCGGHRVEPAAQGHRHPGVAERGLQPFPPGLRVKIHKTVLRHQPGPHQPR
jgi:hypothetical protein